VGIIWREIDDQGFISESVRVIWRLALGSVVDKGRLISMLQNYSQSFKNCIPQCRVTTGQLEIRLIDPSKTVQVRPYRLSAEEKKTS